MPNVATEGIVLKRINYSEADRLITIFTKKLGLVVAIAKGVRKIKSRLAGHLEMFNIVDLRLSEGKNWYIVTGAELILSSSNIKKDLAKTASTYYINELICMLIEEKEPDEKIYKLIKNTYLAIERYDQDYIFAIFSINLLSLLGYKPELFRCVYSKSKLEGKELFFSSMLGGLLDGVHKNADTSALEISINCVKVMRVCSQDFERGFKLGIDTKTKIDFIKICKDYLQSILGKSPKSEKFINKLNR